MGLKTKFMRKQKKKWWFLSIIWDIHGHLNICEIYRVHSDGSRIRLGQPILLEHCIYKDKKNKTPGCGGILDASLDLPMNSAAHTRWKWKLQFMLYSSSCIACVFQIRWFDDPVSRCMQHVDAIETKDLTQKCEFFTKLAQTIPQFPRVSSNNDSTNHQS